MIPEQQIQKTVVDTIVGEEIAFSIKNISNIFELLRKSMYNDKPTAVAREIISNAIDANIESGTDKKILIKFPTKLDQIFSVQDFGIGIDKERMLCLTAFGASTKVNTNKQIGGYGLGIKSPWSISDQFTITTITGGIKYKYLCYLDDVGYGKAKELFAIPTDEASGTTIEIPVTNADYIDRIKRQTELFWLCNPDKITMDNEPELNIYDTLQHRVALRGFLPSNYHVFHWQKYGFGNRIIVLNGYVPYIINHNITEFRLEKVCTFVIKYDIGVLDIPATREAISETTKNNRIIGKIIPKIKKAADNLRSFLIERKEKNEHIAMITKYHSPVKIPEVYFNKENIHSSYNCYGNIARRNEKNYRTPKSPSCYNISDEIIVELDDSKKSNITFQQYAEHIAELNPHTNCVYFAYNNTIDERTKHIFKVVPLHTFAPTPIKKVKVKKTTEELVDEIECKKNRRFYIHMEDICKYETLEGILKEPDKYRKIECFNGSIIDNEISEHFDNLKGNKCSCDYGIFMVNKGDYKHFKDVKSVEVSDFKLSRSSYFAITAAYLMRVISLKLRKNQTYKELLIHSIISHLKSLFVIPCNNQLIYIDDDHRVKLNLREYKEKTKLYKPDEKLLNEYKLVAADCAKKLIELIADIKYVYVMKNSLYYSVLKDSLWEECSDHIQAIFKEYKEMFK